MSISHGRWPPLRRIASSWKSPVSAAPTTFGAPVTVTITSASAIAASARRHGESVEECLQAKHWIDLDDRDDGAGGPEVLRHPASAGPVPEHRYPLAVRAPVGDPDERLEHALPDGMLVLGELLDGAVVDDQDRPRKTFAKGAEAVLDPMSFPPSHHEVPGTGRRASGRRDRRRCRGGGPGRASSTSRRKPSCSDGSAVGPPITRIPAARRYSTAAGWVELRLPVDTTSAPPRARTRISATVFGSRWMPVPIVTPAKGRVRSNSSPIVASSLQLEMTQSMRDIRPTIRSAARGRRSESVVLGGNGDRAR